MIKYLLYASRCNFIRFVKYSKTQKTGNYQYDCFVQNQLLEACCNSFQSHQESAASTFFFFLDCWECKKTCIQSQCLCRTLANHSSVMLAPNAKPETTLKSIFHANTLAANRLREFAQGTTRAHNTHLVKSRKETCPW